MTSSKRKKRRQRHPKLKIVLALTATAGILTVVLLSAGAFAVASIATTLPKLADVKPKPVKLTSKIYDGNGELITELHAEEDREWVSLNQIPQHVQWSIIAIEDARFFEHEGIDFHSIGRALANDVVSGGIVEGGSTITQQYIKNVYLSPERTFMRKVREATLSWELEKTMSKNEILERYLNTIYFGSGAYGVAAAGRKYFGKSLNQLTLGESAMLAGLIRAPDNFSPRRNFKAAKTRQIVVLNRMTELKMITPAQAQAAVNQQIRLSPKPAEPKTTGYFIQYVKEQLIDKYGADRVFGGGLRVYTTIDPRMQAAAEKAVFETLDRPRDPAASMVAISVRSCEIKAMVGGKNFRKKKFNLAVQSHRQTGSAFKIFVLAAALEKKVSIYDTFVSAPRTLPPYKKGAPPWSVSNYGGKYRGAITVEKATIWSDNSVFAQMIMKVGPKHVVDVANRMGITSKVPAIPAIALGGLTTGVSPLEMASAATTLAGEGRRCVTPISIRKVTDSQGRVLEQAKAVKVKGMNRTLARLETQVLTKVISSGTGKAADIGRPVAGKTGTAQNYQDAWFIGYTPEIAAAVWMGYPGAQVAMTSVHGRRVSGGSFPAEIWAKFMKVASRGIPETKFRVPTAKELAKVGQDELKAKDDQDLDEEEDVEGSPRKKSSDNSGNSGQSGSSGSGSGAD